MSGGPRWKETDENLGCLLYVVAFGLLLLIAFHGDQIVNKILGGC